MSSKVIHGARMVRTSGGNYKLALGRGRTLDLADEGQRVNKGRRSIGAVGLVFGDSTADQGFFSAALGHGTTAQNWVGQALAELGGPHTKLVNGGLSNDNSVEMLARLQALLDEHNPRVVYFLGNSVNDPAEGLTADQSNEAEDTAVAMCLDHASVELVFTATAQPVLTGDMETATPTGAVRRKWYSDVNDHKFKRAQLSGGAVGIFDLNRISSAADGSGMQSGDSVDGTHLSYKLIARACRLAIKPTLLKFNIDTPWRMPSSAAEFRNILGPHASAPRGDNASGTGGYLNLAAANTGQGPNGFTSRRGSGDTTATTVSSSIFPSPVELGSRCASMNIAIGANGGSAGFSVGRSVSGTLSNYDNPRANSTAYAHGQRIAISATLNGHVVEATGTRLSAATPPAELATCEEGDYIVDGEVTWQVVHRPQVGEWYDFAVDHSLLNLAGVATSAAKAGNVGVGTMGAITVAPGTPPGDYKLTVITAASNAGVFTLQDPDGIVVGMGNVGSAFTGGGLTFTLADGATDYVVGDQHTITVSAGGATSAVWINIIDSAGTQVERWINYAGVTNQVWPSKIDGSRRLLRQTFQIPTTLIDVRTIQVACLAMGANGTTCTLQVHSMAADLVEQ